MAGEYYWKGMIWDNSSSADTASSVMFSTGWIEIDNPNGTSTVNEQHVIGIDIAWTDSTEYDEPTPFPYELSLADYAEERKRQRDTEKEREKIEKLKFLDREMDDWRASKRPMKYYHLYKHRS